MMNRGGKKQAPSCFNFGVQQGHTVIEAGTYLVLSALLAAKTGLILVIAQVDGLTGNILLRCNTLGSSFHQQITVAVLSRAGSDN